MWHGKSSLGSLQAGFPHCQWFYPASCAKMCYYSLVVSSGSWSALVSPVHAWRRLHGGLILVLELVLYYR